jgi:hypothetical protein
MPKEIVPEIKQEPEVLPEPEEDKSVELEDLLNLDTATLKEKLKQMRMNAPPCGDKGLYIVGRGKGVDRPFVDVAVAYFRLGDKSIADFLISLTFKN